MTTVTPVARYWKSTRVLGWWLIAALAVLGALNVVAAFVDNGKAWERIHAALQASSDGDTALANQRFAHAFDNSGRPWLQIAGYAGLVVLVLFIIWTYRSAENALALRRVGARQSPGWTIAGWLVPILNLLMPYQTLSDLWRSSDPRAAPGDGWRALHPSVRVVGWWVASLVSAFATGSVVLLMLTGDLNAADARPYLAAAHVLGALGCSLGAWVVLVITRRQEAQQEADPAPLRGSLPAMVVQPVALGPGGLPVAGWYPDPHGVFDHRYWDGRAWTEQVSRNGVTDVAPVIGPEWYPDPTGRHAWRFWGGTGWTEHVADDGVMGVDPHGPGELEAPPPA